MEWTRPEIHGSLGGAGSGSFFSSFADDAPAPADVGLVDALQDPLLGALWALLPHLSDRMRPAQQQWVVAAAWLTTGCRFLSTYAITADPEPQGGRQ